MQSTFYKVAGQFVSGAVFLFGALSFVVDSGYSWGPALLLLAALGLVPFKKHWPAVSRETWGIVLIFIIYAVVWGAEVWLTGQRSREFDKPSRFLAACLVFLLVMRVPPSQVALWSGLAIGAIGAVLLGGWQVIFEGESRASGLTMTIQFGNLSLLFGFLCLCGVFAWGRFSSRRSAVVAFLVLGAASGLCASLWSGSRGGWLALPVALVIGLYYTREWLNKKRVSLIVGGTLVALVVLVAVPQFGVQARIDTAVEQFHEYQAGAETGSVGKRLEMWKAAWIMIQEEPLVGRGELGYKERLGELAEEGRVFPSMVEYSHAHNEYLDIAAKRGVLGLLSLLLLYLGTAFLFWRRGQLATNPRAVAVSAAGVLVCISYAVFSLTQGFLSHNSGVMVFAFLIVFLWSILETQVTAKD